MILEPLWDVQGALRSRTTNVHKATQIVAVCEFKNASESLRKEQTDCIEGEMTKQGERQLMVAIVEQVELGSMTELSLSGHVLRWARQ